MNKTTFIVLFALLTTHHQQVKPGLITNIAVAAAVAAATVYVIVVAKESQKSDVDKTIDTATHTANDGINKTGQFLKDLFRKNKS